MSTPLPEKVEKIIAWHTEEELKLRGFTREGLREFIAGRIERCPQDASSATYQSFPTAQQRRELALRQTGE